MPPIDRFHSSIIAHPETDDRPRCVFLVGNGVTIDFLYQFGISDQINTSKLIPPPDWVQELKIPRSGSNVSPPLWSPERYPELWATWQEYVVRNGDDLFQTFCEFSLTQPGFLPPEVDGAFPTLISNIPGAQLRYYLWHLFVEYDKAFRASAHDERKLFAWKWFDFARSIFSAYRVTVVSYNYDCFFDSCLGALGFNCFMPAHSCVEQWLNCDANESVILKPHGTIAHVSFSGFGGAEGAASFIAVGCNGPQFSECRYPPPNACPSLPDLVPPGHSNAHYANSAVGMQLAVELAMRDCDTLIVAGFSARGPDETELLAYCDKLKNVTAIANIGRKQELSQSKSHMLLEPMAIQKCATYRFFDRNDLSDACIWLKENAARSRRHANRLDYFREISGEYFPKLQIVP